jgi:hypothetical protein
MYFTATSRQLLQLLIIQMLQHELGCTAPFDMHCWCVNMTINALLQTAAVHDYWHKCIIGGWRLHNDAKAGT